MERMALEQLNAKSREDFARALGEVFEHAPWVAERAYAARPFGSVTALYEAMTAAVRDADDAAQMTLIANHPDLAGKAARQGAITEDSKREQTSAGLDRLSDDEFAAFHRLNDAYRAKFAMPFVVCVRRHGKDSILGEFERRLNNDAASERQTALREIFRIVALRLDQRVAAADRLKVDGRLSTHVLDTLDGRPAAGVAVELFELFRSGSSRLIARATTNEDGRTDRPLIAGQPVPIARYELRFDIGAYFARRAARLADPPFLGVVPVRFAVAEPEGYYHVPLIATPWSYTTYRGS